MQLLKKSRLVGTQEAVAGALWVLAGTDIDDQRNMATMIGVTHLSEFLDSPSEHLQLLGLEIFSILASGPKDFGRALAGMGVPQLLVRLLHSNNERIVLASVRTMRHICLGISWIPNTENQEMLLNSQGLNFLVALMSHSHSDLLQAEAACALASAVLGNRGNAELLYGHGDFSYSFILRLLYSQFREVRLLAGVAIATFAFNNMAQQKQIAEAGGVHWHNFQPFFLSSDPLERLNAAFQCVVLSSIIPNQKPASIRALGIKTIVDIMEEPHSKPVLALAADCVGRLAHTRAGIPSAIISINSVSVLCDLMTSSSEQIQGSAAIALGFLSFNHNGNRQLLKCCRESPLLAKILLHYTRGRRLSHNFLEGWKHLTKLGLPPIRVGGSIYPDSKAGSSPGLATSSSRGTALHIPSLTPSQFKVTNPSNMHMVRM
ncbi:ankyrin and armadillo repeat-containing protein-like [Polypterus senegalus]|uniref:ankyrin and armadillo repeat-containing protein-like n=1 Tax=Polypterus senegalus TaxID=55291 RepID=UPI0019653590|nr:ankyrin and armadillo repeat-containing protein-like [Polypterus senegalus]